MTVTDVSFSIGKSHKVCQDYGLAGDDLVAISDGCSSSPHTDIGARLLVHSAFKGGSPEVIVERAMLNRVGMDLPPECLDATLLVARQTRRAVEVRIYGDGLIVGVRKDGHYVCHQHTYSHNAPAYLSYLTQRSRYAAYMSAQGALTIQTWEDSCQDFRDYTTTANPESIFTYWFPQDQYDMVLLLTDGVSSFQKRCGTAFAPVPVCEVLAQVMDFKSVSPGFVQRRMNRFLNKFCPDNGWVHTDDLTVGAVYMGSEPCE